MRQILIAMILAGSGLAASGGDLPLYLWKTFSGHPGGIGNADGPGGVARFHYPSGISADDAGNLFIADTYNNTIRKIAADGVVTTIAGTAGLAGSADGTNSAARFSSPSTLAVDGSGNVYVADTGNNSIRKITPDGTVTTLAGRAGYVGNADGLGQDARFNEPYGVALDGAGDLYVTDSANSTLRKITSDGAVTTLAGKAGVSGSTDGTNSAARFAYPAGLAVDGVGNIFIADLNNATIRRVTSDGVVTTLAGSAGQIGGSDGTNGAARFSYPFGIAVDDDGNLYVADTYNSTIRKVTADGVVTTLAGDSAEAGNADGAGGDARFNFPAGITVDGSNNVFVADTDNSSIRKISGGWVATIAGSADQSGAADASGGAARFWNPSGVAVDAAGNVFVADTFNSIIRKVTRGGLVTTLAGSAGEIGGTNGAADMARFNNPYAIAVNASGGLFIADTFNHTIRRMTNGIVTVWAGSAGAAGSTNGVGEAARFSSPTGIAADGAGNVYVADFANHIIRKIGADAAVTTIAGTAGQTGSVDDAGAAARFNGPFGVASDSDGNLFVTDSGNHTVRKITTNGVVTTFAGSAGQPGSADGTNDAARFFGPAGIALDAAGNLYVADLGNATIRKITSAGVVTTLAGSAGQIGSADGTGDIARFYSPSGVAADSAGNVYVADAGNSTIRKITSAGVVTTLAGSAGLTGSDDVSAAAARFFGPSGLAMDAESHLLVADTYNSSIRRVSSDGAVETIAGLSGFAGDTDGPISSARFSYPLGLAATDAGDVYVADSYNGSIRKVNNGAVTTFAGMSGEPGTEDGPLDTAHFSYPSGIVAGGEETLFVADYDASTIRKISDGIVTTLAGSADEPGSENGFGAAARFDGPNGIALDGSGNLYVADSGNSTIRKITSAGEVTVLAGAAGEAGFADGVGGVARFDYPFAVTADKSGSVFVADSGNSTIRQVTSNGVVTTIGGVPGVLGGTDGIGGEALFSAPGGIVVDGRSRLYVADFGNNRICRGVQLPVLRIASSAGALVVSWPSPSYDFILQENSDVARPTAWSATTNSVCDDGTNKFVTLTEPFEGQFFRLIEE